MAAAGRLSVCFSCGQPLPDDAAPGGAAGAFPLTGAFNAEAIVPPANPYQSFSAAVLSGATGAHAVRGDQEIRVGRDPAQCGVLLHEPRVSGLHATLKWEGNQLWVRDEQSNNGTWVDGTRTAPSVWTPVRAGASVRFGPIDFGVRYE